VRAVQRGARLQIKVADGSFDAQALDGQGERRTTE